MSNESPISWKKAVQPSPGMSGTILRDELPSHRRDSSNKTIYINPRYLQRSLLENRNEQNNAHGVFGSTFQTQGKTSAPSPLFVPGSSTTAESIATAITRSDLSTDSQKKSSHNEYLNKVLAQRLANIESSSDDDTDVRKTSKDFSQGIPCNDLSSGLSHSTQSLEEDDQMRFLTLALKQARENSSTTKDTNGDQHLVKYRSQGHRKDNFDLDGGKNTNKDRYLVKRRSQDLRRDHDFDGDDGKITYLQNLVLEKMEQSLQLGKKVPSELLDRYQRILNYMSLASKLKSNSRNPMRPVTHFSAENTSKLHASDPESDPDISYSSKQMPLQKEGSTSRRYCNRDAKFQR